MRYCTNCGSSLDEGDAFCTNCGCTVPEGERRSGREVSRTVVQAPAVAPVPAPMPAPASPAPTAGVVEEWTAGTKDAGTERDGSKKVAIAALVVAALALALAGVVVFSLRSGSGGAGVGSGAVAGESSLSGYSWEELSDISGEIASAGSDAEALEVARSYGLVDGAGRLSGDTKALELTDGTQCRVRIAGFCHDALPGGGRAGITLESADVPVARRMNAANDNSDGWEASEVRLWLNGEFYDLLPDDLRPLVVAVEKRTNNVGHTARDDASCVGTTTDRVWLPSATEVFGPIPTDNVRQGVYRAEGSQYQLYADQGVTVGSFGFCRKDGASSWWWLRSPRAGDGEHFNNVSSSGGWDSHNRADNGAGGVSPWFCL